MKKKKEVTKWYRIVREFNHIEDGHSANSAPVAISPEQERAWKEVHWYKVFSFIDEDNQVAP